MKVVILCGGKGIRLSEYTVKIPKPMVKIGNRPLLWHLMKYYSKFGYNDFILCLGYKGHTIRKYFSKNKDNWKIKLLNTGIDSSKAKRLHMAKDFIDSDDFFVAYGDDISNVDIKKILKYHKQKKKTVTLTIIKPLSQYGILEINRNNEVIYFKEKPRLDHWINGGFFVFNKKIFSHFRKGWELEDEVFASLAKKRKIVAFKHNGFWKSVNTLKDYIELNEIWKNKKRFC